MQSPSGKPAQSAASVQNQDPNIRAHVIKRSRTTYRLRRIHESFDRESLEIALCTYFGIDKNGLTIHSLAYDAPYGHQYREKVATITFQVIPKELEAGKRWPIEIPTPQGQSCAAYLDTEFGDFTPLTPAEKEDDTTVDCILIHGWAGHPIGSFSSPDHDGWFWPRDGLCHDIPSLRVWLYGYSSILQDASKRTDVYEYAETFRRALRDARKAANVKIPNEISSPMQKSETASRPLIYIVHSLGGTILQDAIISMTTSDHADDRTNINNTKGALLFGVPSGGMNNKKLMSLLQQDNVPAAYTAALLDEESGFTQRMRQADSFRKACLKNGASTYTFYETQMTPTVRKDEETQRWVRDGPLAMLVSKESATSVAFESQNKIPWESDHNTMLKLGRDDTRYETLIGRVREVVNQTNSHDDQGMQSPASTFHSTTPGNNYKIPFSIRGLPTTKIFIDRPAEMQRLEKVLLPASESQEQKIFVLHGLGGIGKTQLARKFLRLHHNKFSAVFWINGSTKDSLKQGLAHYASKIAQVSEKNRPFIQDGESDIDTAVQQVLEWLAIAENTTWLLVFDNVDRKFLSSDPFSYNIKDYLPDAEHGSILITTRLSLLQQLGESEELTRVHKAIAEDILKGWCKSAYGKIESLKSFVNLAVDDAEINKLLEKLDGLPLAIAQAGAYIQRRGTSIAKYLQLYDDQWDEVTQPLDDSRAQLDDYAGRSIYTTWNISYDAILAADKFTANLLVFWSYLDNKDLWFGIFAGVSPTSELANMLKVWLGEIASKESAFDDAIQTLRDYSLVETVCDEDSLTMHAVVHHWARSVHGPKTQEELGLFASAVVGSAIPTEPGRSIGSIQQRLISHAQACSDLLFEIAIMQRSDTRQNEIICKTFYNFSYLYADQDKLDVAEKFALQGLQECEEVLGPKHQLTLDTVNSLGMRYFQQEKHEKAEAMFLRALRGYEEVLGAEDISTLRAVANLGLLYDDIGKLSDAETMCTRALQGYEILGAKPATILHIINTLAIVYVEQGKLSQAEPMFERVLQSSEEILDPKHITILTTTGYMGFLYAGLGKLVEAKQMSLRSLSGFEETLGAKHSVTLEAKKNLGVVCSIQGRLDEAEQMLLSALAGLKEVRGENHVITLETMAKLGHVYTKQGRLAEAEKILLQVVAPKEALNAKPISRLEVSSKLGNLYTKQGRFDKAQKILQGVLAGSAEADITDSISTFGTLSYLGLLYAQQGRSEEAENSYLRALQGYQEAMGVEYTQTYLPALSTWRKLGELFAETQPEKSRAMYEKALLGYKIVHGASANICLDLEKRIDVLSQDTTSKNSQSTLNKDKAKPRKPKGTTGKFKKLIRKVKT